MLSMALVSERIVPLAVRTSGVFTPTPDRLVREQNPSASSEVGGWRLKY
jgi:hypothetical protein